MTGGPSLQRRPGGAAPRASSMWGPSPLIGRASGPPQRPQTHPGGGLGPLSMAAPLPGPIHQLKLRHRLSRPAGAGAGCLLPSAVCKPSALLNEQSR